MPNSDDHRTNPRFQITLDRYTVRIVERVRKKVLRSASRSAAIRYLAAYYDDHEAETEQRGPHVTT